MTSDLTNNGTITIYFFGIAWQNQLFNWLKFGFRCMLTLYVMYDTVKHYYLPYQTLKSNLQDKGISPGNFNKYEIFIGDPTCLVLSNPIVSMAFVIDIWLSIGVMGSCILRAGQYQDINHWF